MPNIVTKTVSFAWKGKEISYLLALDASLANELEIARSLDQGVIPQLEIAYPMLRALQKGDTAIDVGANIGFFTCLMSKMVGDSGHVVSYEPAPDNLQVLHHNVRANQMTNTLLIPKPCWSKEQELVLHLNADNRSSHSIYDPGEWYDNIMSRANPEAIPTHTTLLDIAPCAHDKVRLIKIDAEGADMEVLKGAKGLLTKHRVPFIIFEFNPMGMHQAGWTAPECRQFMRELGYDMFFLHEDGSLPALVPEKVEVAFLHGVRAMNVLFSRLDAISQAWPEACG